MNNQEVEEEVEEVAEVEHEQVEADAISVIGTSQLLFDIVTEEENHDLDTLVTSTVISFFFWFWFLVLVLDWSFPIRFGSVLPISDIGYQFL